MWEGYYGKEPFNFRLTALRFVRSLSMILAISFMGTLVFGGGYYVKNVLLRRDTAYTATTTYMVTYVNPPVHSGDYFINEMSWNTLVQSGEFVDAVQEQLVQMAKEAKEEAVDISVMASNLSKEEVSGMISAKLPSDWHIPTTAVTAGDRQLATQVAAAVEIAMIQALPEMTEALSAVDVIDPAGDAVEVEPDVRPERAVILSAILSFFFAAVIFLLRELGDDSIWLPSSLRWRYGLKTLGTIHSPEFQENLEYLFAGKESIAVCPLDGRVDSAAVVRQLAKEWIPMPAPVLCPESCRKLRQADGILLVVPAGKRVGKTLEYVLEYLKQQDCEITAALLWDADELLLKVYYGLDGKA